MEILKIIKEMASAASRIYVLSWKAVYHDIVPEKYLDDLSLEHWTTFLQNFSYECFVLKVDGQFVATPSISPAGDESMCGWGRLFLFTFCQSKRVKDMVKCCFHLL